LTSSIILLDPFSIIFCSSCPFSTRFWDPFSIRFCDPFSIRCCDPFSIRFSFSSNWMSCPLVRWLVSAFFRLLS
jgi:hypothetical protein